MLVMHITDLYFPIYGWLQFELVYKVQNWPGKPLAYTIDNFRFDDLFLASNLGIICELDTIWYQTLS